VDNGGEDVENQAPRRLTRCKDQKSATLDEFYTEISEQDNYASRESGKAMLDLIARLQALPDDRHVFGLTSHYRLCFLAKDSYKSPWFVLVWALDSRNYFVEYRMPEDIAPWPHAFVRGEARSEDDAIEMIMTAMDKSGGWNQSVTAKSGHH
jgi:hypothetical protein